MGSKIKHRARGNLPAPHIPYPVQNRILREHNQALKEQLNRMCRLLWACVSEAGGRVEMDEADYRMAMAMPDEDSIVSVKHDKQSGKVALVHTDAGGNILPESEPKLVIATDAP